jgi:hypothetical protein
MTVLLVTYDLNKPGQDYSEFIATFKKYPWAKLSESSYAIDTSKSPSAIYEELEPYTDEGDHVYIIKLSNPWMGYGPKKVNSWLDDNL